MTTYYGDFELTPVELEKIFAEKGWMWAGDGVYGCPTEIDIRHKIGEMVAMLSEDDDYYLVQSNRLAVARNSAFPDSYEIYLCVGHIDLNSEDTEGCAA